MNNENVEFLIYSDNCFTQVRKFASEYKTRIDHILPKEYWEELSSLKKNAVNSSDQLTAKVAWCFETIGEIQDKFIEIYIHFINDEFYKGWCLLERCEILIGFLDRHFHEKDHEFGIEHIRIHTKNFQSLFPYKNFISPEFISHNRCSVCKELITPRNHCKHKVGEIYDGEMCCKVAENVELLGVAIVNNPVQKYSVINHENCDYEPIKDLVKRLLSPWRTWTYTKLIKLVPIYENIGRNEVCPCGSRLKYKNCCLRKKRKIEHFEIKFQ